MKFQNLSQYILAPLLLVLFANSTSAQKHARTYQDAEEALHAEDYKTALLEYLEVAAIDPNFESTEYKLELCSLMQDSDYPLDNYLQLETDYSTDEYYYYWLGKVYMSRYMFEDASSTLKLFHQKVEYSGNTEDEDALRLIETSAHLMSFFDNPDNYEIHQLESPVNSDGDELSPVFFEDKKELLFASSRGSVYPKVYKIYYVKKDDNGWGSLTEVKTLGRFDETTANIEVVNEDGKLFLFREDNGGDLYYSQPSGETWTIPVEFDSRISNNHLHSHFFINEHEDRIIFSSDERGSGLDLYESYIDPDNGKWTKPEDFSIDINTPFDEDSPYLSPDETKLYFVSDRPGGVGGKDVYLSELDLDEFKWSNPKNLGWPINSPDNEFHFKMNEDQTSGYFVSDRVHSKGENDIYFFWEVEKVNITGRLVDREGNPMTDVQIRFHPSQYLDEYFHSKTNASGMYSTKIISDEIFNVEILQDGKVIYNEKFEVHDAKGQAITHHKDFKVQ
ncbi:MAG: hypothetical protein ABJG41_11565 [Cyclobacteriaceae bacterium]